MLADRVRVRGVAGSRSNLIGDLEGTLSRAEEVFDAASSLVGDEAFATWQQLPDDAQAAESKLRSVVAKRIDHDVTHDGATDRR